jgi:hypothetical protein
MSANFADHRRSRRAGLKLRGRYMLSDGGEFPCQTIDVSATGVAVQAYVVANLGERVVAYLDELGRIEGVVVRRGDDWFAIEARTSQSRIDRIAQKIAALSGESSEAFAVASTGARDRPATLRTAFGQDFAVRVSDETKAGAKVLADFKLLPGTHVTIDGLRAVVDHDSPDGFLVVFDRGPAGRLAQSSQM